MPRETWNIELRAYSGVDDIPKTQKFRVTASSPKAARDIARKKVGQRAPDYYIADQTKV